MMLLFVNLILGILTLPTAVAPPLCERCGPTLSVAPVSDSLDIQYLELSSNPLLLKEVRKYIREQNDSSQLFKNGFGYVVIRNVKTVRNGEPIPAAAFEAHLKDVEVGFDLELTSFYPHQGIGTPLYYSFVDKRLVLIFDQNLAWIHGNRYSASSQQKVKDLIRQTLVMEQSTDFVFRGLEGIFFKLTPEHRKILTSEQVMELGSFTLQHLKTVIQHVDGSISYH
nr:hypothetical protein [uncultured Dyadobacter sp.]